MKDATPLADKLIRPNGFHSLGAECACGWLERDCLSEQMRDGDGEGHERRMGARECEHPLVELLSVNGRNLDGAQRVCAVCKEAA